MKDQSTAGRVIGLDCHPDSFTAAIVVGATPREAILEKSFDKVPLSRLRAWAEKYARPSDTMVLEASGNSFTIVRILEKCGCKALVLESCQMGKLKNAHANDDRVSALRIAKAYLAGTAKTVWVPDEKTQERRDLFHAYRKAVKRTTQTRARVRSYLSDKGVRLKKKTSLIEPGVVEEQVRAGYTWTPAQWRVLETFLLELRQGEQQRQRWHQLMAQEVAADPALASLVRLRGVREITAFALAAFIGDIKRFANPKKLVSYLGLSPSFDNSGESSWSGGVGCRGHQILRNLMVEGAHAILRGGQNPVSKWGRRLLARKGVINLVVCAIARRLTVSVWHLMMGHWTTLTEVDRTLSLKIGKIITAIGDDALKALATNRKSLRRQVIDQLSERKTYIVNPPKSLPAAAAPA